MLILKIENGKRKMNKTETYGDLVKYNSLTGCLGTV